MDSRAITVNAEEVLRTLPQNKAFHFFEDINEYTGKSASNLVEFCEMAKTVNKNSITFHFERHDFERWTKETLHDPTLARRISKLKKSQSEEKMSEEEVRTLIYQITKNRLGELKNRLPDKRHTVHSKTAKARKHKNTKKTSTKVTRKKANNN